MSITRISSEQKLKKARETLFRFDKIRLSKLLELIQTGLVIFIVCLIFGSFFDNLFPILDDKCSNLELITQTTLHISLNIVLIYYIRKISEEIPFLFSLTDEYVSNAKGEQVLASMLMIGVIFYKPQTSFQKKLNLIQERFSLRKKE